MRGLRAPCVRRSCSQVHALWARPDALSQPQRRRAPPGLGFRVEPMSPGRVPAPDWDAVISAAARGDGPALAAAVRDALATANYRVARSHLTDALAGSPTAPQTLVSAFLSEVAAGEGAADAGPLPDAGASQAAFLLLDLAAGTGGGAGRGGAGMLGGRAVLRCAAPRMGRVAARAAVSFRVIAADLGAAARDMGLLQESAAGVGRALGWPQTGAGLGTVLEGWAPSLADEAAGAALATALVRVLVGEGAFTPALALAGHFPDVLRQMPARDLITGAVEAGQDGAGHSLAASMGDAERCALVDACLGAGRLKAALLYVREFQLHDRYPRLEMDYKAHVVERLVEVGLWPLAAAVAGSGMEPEFRSLQRRLVMDMVAAGELSLAQEHRTLFGIEDLVPEMDEASVASELRRRQERFLDLDLDPSRVTVVDSEETLRSAEETIAAFLASAAPGAAVGLDVEWRPEGLAAPRGARAAATEEAVDRALDAAVAGARGGKRTERGRASLLQVATGDACLLFDLHALGEDTALSGALGPLLSSPRVAKLGLGIAGDLQRLRQGFPNQTAFHHVAPVTDLGAVWAEKCRRETGRRRAVPMGLSAVAEAVLGKPLDKAMQVSDWDRRPLSARQVHYAALDAHVTVRIYEAMGAERVADLSGSDRAGQTP